MTTIVLAACIPPMPEADVNVETTHHLLGTESESPRFGSAVEIVEAILLALVAVSTAWSGYQSARWDGRSVSYYGESSKIRITATAAGTRAGQEQLYDATTLNAWLQASLTGETTVAREFERRFRPEYRPAFRAWLATDPLHNPKAPLGPLYMPQYTNPLAERAAALEVQASNVFDRGTEARDTGDNYVRTTVILATVLFLIALSQRFRLFGVRAALLTVALVLLAISLASLASYPRH